MSADGGFRTVPLSELARRQIRPDNSPHRRVVLVVDDEVLIADTLAAILNNNGFAATPAYNGASALDLAQVIPPDLLITDVLMPGMTGIELAVAITKSFPDCKVLLFSGQAATNDLLSEARAQGYDFNVLAKPVHPKEILAKLWEFTGERPAN